MNEITEQDIKTVMEWMHSDGEYFDHCMHGYEVFDYLIKRLEIWDYDNKRMLIGFDGITCRDETIKQLEEENSKLKDGLIRIYEENNWIPKGHWAYPFIEGLLQGGKLNNE